ncbi:MAG TPA: hypothetical protein VGC11_09810 [Acidimicrobiia bacterium]
MGLAHEAGRRLAAALRSAPGIARLVDTRAVGRGPDFTFSWCGIQVSLVLVGVVRPASASPDEATDGRRLPPALLLDQRALDRLVAGTGVTMLVVGADHHDRWCVLGPSALASARPITHRGRQPLPPAEHRMAVDLSSDEVSDEDLVDRLGSLVRTEALDLGLDPSSESVPTHTHSEEVPRPPEPGSGGRAFTAA